MTLGSQETEHTPCGSLLRVVERVTARKSCEAANCCCAQFSAKRPTGLVFAVERVGHGTCLSLAIEDPRFVQRRLNRASPFHHSFGSTRAAILRLKFTSVVEFETRRPTRVLYPYPNVIARLELATDKVLHYHLSTLKSPAFSRKSATLKGGIAAGLRQSHISASGRLLTCFA